MIKVLAKVLIFSNNWQVWGNVSHFLVYAVMFVFFIPCFAVHMLNRKAWVSVHEKGNFFLFALI
jgi:hypothetical protein